MDKPTAKILQFRPKTKPTQSERVYTTQGKLDHALERILAYAATLAPTLRRD